MGFVGSFADGNTSASPIPRDGKPLSTPIAADVSGVTLSRPTIVAVIVVLAIWFALTPALTVGAGADMPRYITQGAALLIVAGLFNVVPDFLSLWETRGLIGWMGGGTWVRALGLDLLFTTVISVALIFGTVRLAFGYDPIPADGAEFSQVDPTGVVTTQQYPSGGWAKGGEMFIELITLQPRVGRFEVGDMRVLRMEAPDVDLPLGLFFYSAFFTSVWLWLYLLTWGLSRLLLRMNSGVGFLLRATDVERQPFRSMGFVSVIIVSGLFALGLPLVLL